MRFLPRASQGATAAILVLTTAVVVAQSTVGVVAADWFPAQIHVRGWECHVGADAIPRQRTLVLYDNKGRYAAYGAQTAVLAANFVSHFARPVRRPVTSYRRGEMSRFAAVVYVGTDYGEPLPRAFLSDVRAGLRPMLWLGGNAYQLTDPAFARRRGWRAGPARVRRYVAVMYRHVRLTINTSTLDGIKVSNPAAATVLGWAVASGGRRTPWAVRSGNLTYVSEVPLSSGGGRDRSFAVADMMAGMFGLVGQRHRALIRLEDVGPAADPLQLRQIADVLAARHIPFSVAVYPVYLGPVTQHPRERITLGDRPQLVEAIKYMLSKGGSLILHGYTHQLGGLRNPNNGESGEDYEFLRVRYNGRHILTYANVADDPTAWARHRIDLALAAIRAAGLPRPELWQFPEYGASPAEYRVAASMFAARFERGNYAEGRPGHEKLQTLTEQAPPYLVRDVYGGPLLPENLGYVMGPHVRATGPGSVQGILAAAAAQKAAVRDNVASVYYHPFLGTGPLRRLVDGLQHEGYQFVSPCAVLKG